MFLLGRGLNTGPSRLASAVVQYYDEIIIITIKMCKAKTLEWEGWSTVWKLLIPIKYSNNI